MWAKIGFDPKVLFLTIFNHFYDKVFNLVDVYIEVRIKLDLKDK